jgi:hypothetical protein
VQRRIVWIGALVFLLALGGSLGGFFLLRKIKGDRPREMWVPLPVVAELDEAMREKIVGELRAAVDEGMLLRVSRDNRLAQQWGLPSEEACAAEIRRRMFVRSGEADTPLGKVPAIHVGIRGPAREMALSGQLSTALVFELQKTSKLGFVPAARREAGEP